MLSTAPTPQNRASRGRARGLKTRVWGFCRRPASRAPVFGLQTTKPRRVAKVAATKTASGPSQWLSRDPIEEDGGINLYAYAWNDPVNLFDADGRIPMSASAAQSMYAQSLASRYAPQAAAARGIAAINSAGNAVTCTVNSIASSPATRVAHGTVQAVSGVSNIVAGTATVSAGAAATVTIPGVGQVGGPAAIAIGTGRIGWGMYSFGSGMNNIAQGSQGIGRGPLLPPFQPIPMPPMPPPPPGTSGSGNGCPPQPCP